MNVWSEWLENVVGIYWVSYTISQIGLHIVVNVTINISKKTCSLHYEEQSNLSILYLTNYLVEVKDVLYY